MDDPAKEFADNFSMFVNSRGRDVIREAAELSTHDHLTLVQHKMFFCIKFIEAVAKMEHRSDLRNQASVEIANQIISKIPNRLLPII